MMQAIVAGRTFVLDDALAHSPFVDPKRCASRGYSCLFEPPSPCGVRHAGLGESEAAAVLLTLPDHSPSGCFCPSLTTATLGASAPP